MDKHTFKVLEYEIVREMLALKTTSIFGREAIEKRYPLKDIQEIINIQNQTNEALLILNSKEPFTVGDLPDTREYVEMATKGIPLRPEEILEVNETAIRSRLLKQFISTREALFPHIHQFCIKLETFPDIENSVRKAIGSDGRILDSASNKLEDIRHSIGVLNNRIQGQMENFLKNPEYLKMLQEPIITRREHRYVLPVKQEFRSQFPGITLDTSASGATLFMEPLTVLKLTNELKYQESEEKREEEQIRLKLSQKIAEVSENLLKNMEIMGNYDALQAAARFMIDFNCVLPRIQEAPILDLKKARHPLLKERAVPIDISVGDKFRGLIITGPNTGGKTVTLKTAGLLVLMSLAGFPIPAMEESTVGMFTGIFADIGDEQSISQNLSTFSSHMTNIIRILPGSGKRSLILLDEIGAGTDPSEGVALASGTLKYLIDRGSCVIATTHYNELKVFASRSFEFCNAAMEFDDETLAPTYKIQMGLPGRSCALMIAERLGVPPEILDESKKFMDTGYFRIEYLLSEINQEKSRIIKERQDAQENRESLEKYKDEYLKKLENIEIEKSAILEQARMQAEELLTDLERELASVRQQWRKSLKEYKEGKKSREEIRTEESEIRSYIDKTILHLRKMQKKDELEVEQQIQKSFSENEPVFATTLSRRGKVVRMLDENIALVQIGNVKIEIPARDLEHVDLDFKEEPEYMHDLRLSKAMTISDRLDIRGFTVEEGINALAKFIDDACLANLDFFTIIHGKGTGILRDGIREYLKSVPRIKSFRDGELHEGSWGVTVVNL